MRRAVAALAAGLCLASAACSAEPGADPPTATPTATAPPTTTSSTTPTSSAPATSTPGDLKAPVMPAQARVNSRAGAKAFVRYFVDTLNFSWQALRPDALSAESSKRCHVCRLISKRITKMRSNGGYQHGGEWSPTRIFPLPGQTDEQSKFLVTVRIAKGSWKSAAGDSPQAIVAGTVTNEFYLVWSPAGWRVFDLRST